MTLSLPETNDSSRCPLCGQPNACSFDQGTTCWCALPELGRLQPTAPADRCYCRSCLEQMLREQRRNTT